MNRILSIVFILIATLHCQGQSNYDPKIQRLVEITDQATFTEFWSEFEPFKDSASNEIETGNLRLFGNRRKFRSYGFGFSEYKLNIQKILEVEGSTFSSVRYRLRILFDDRDSTIFYNSLTLCQGYGHDEFEITKELSYDSVQFETYFARHDSLYTTQTFRNFSSPPFISKKYFGPICPNHGSVQHDEMIAAVENNQKKVLLDWIRSFNIEDKAYGAAGLYFLREKGVVLTKEEELMLEMTRKLRANVQTDLRIDYLQSVLYKGTLDRRFERYCGD